MTIVIGHYDLGIVLVMEASGSFHEEPWQLIGSKATWLLSSSKYVG